MLDIDDRRTLALVSTEPGAIDAQYARKPNQPAGAWLEYDVAPSKRRGALRVRQAVEMRPLTKRDRAKFGAQNESVELWHILQIGKPMPFARC